MTMFFTPGRQLHTQFHPINLKQLPTIHTRKSHAFFPGTYIMKIDQFERKKEEKSQQTSFTFNTPSVES